MGTAIGFEGVSKRYRLGTGLGELRHFTPDPLAALRRWRRRRAGDAAPDGDGEAARELWALREVSFEVEQGDSLGLVGPNGAGKSTILKLLAGITEPTLGRLHTRGRITALIALGAGFHDDLTGRENIYLNGAVMGLSRREIEAKFDSIVEFSELTQFLDTPVKRYSSGMYMRLGFSVAVHLEPDVLLVDEVLAVGDAAFQSKSYAKIAQIIGGGATVVFVSHNTGAVRQVCRQALLLWQGRVAARGASVDITQKYLQRVRDAREQEGVSGGSDVAGRKGRILGVSLWGEEGGPRQTFATGEPMRVRLSLAARQRVDRPIVRVGLWRAGLGELAIFDTELDGVRMQPVEGEMVIDLVIPSLHLPAGEYRVSPCFSEGTQMNHLDWHDRVYRLDVTEGAIAISPTDLPHEWEVGAAGGLSPSRPPSARGAAAPG